MRVAHSERMGKKHFLQGFLFILVACTKATPGPEYADADQLAAIATFEGIYESEDGSITTTLCESDAVPVNTCQSAFHIRRASNDENDTEGAGVGCGGCPFDEVTTGVRAEVIRDGETTLFEGMLSLGEEASHHEAAELLPPFTLDYATALEEPHEHVDAKVVVNEDRSVTLTFDGDEIVLQRVGDTDCVHRPIE